ncbi:MAG: glucoamylase family protein, partial [Verrucomicrobiota bacterium]
SFLFAREVFGENSEVENEIRTLATKLWEEIEWSHFIRGEKGHEYLVWHWSPQFGFAKDLPIGGSFNEAQIVYLLAMVSPTYPISRSVYESGWNEKSNPRRALGVDLELGRYPFGGPMFFLHYSYLGLDPREISFNGTPYFDHFRAMTEVQRLYAATRSEDFKGYDSFWGITASYGPDRYDAHHPGGRDNGTIAPTAALGSAPYLTEEVLKVAERMYREGKRLWGPFGFYDAFNPTRDWVARGYLGIDVGPIAPMIENAQSGRCWEVFMQSPEAQEITKILEEPSAR